MGGMWQYPMYPQFRAQTTTTSSTTSNLDCTRQSKRKKPQAPESPPLDHKCSEYHDPLILSKDLIRHVKRSCGLNSTRSRTAARAIVQCLQDSLPESTKLHLLTEILTAMDMSYMSRRAEPSRSSKHQEGREERRKRTRTRTAQDSDEVNILTSSSRLNSLKLQGFSNPTLSNISPFNLFYQSQRISYLLRT